MASYTKDDSQLAHSRANKRANAQARLEARRAAMAQKHTKQLEANGAPAAVVEEIVKEEVLPASSFWWFCSIWWYRILMSVAFSRSYCIARV